MTKEKILFILLMSFIGLFVFISVNAASSEDKPQGKPFEEIREDINELEDNMVVLQEEVFEKEKSGIWKAIYELQDKVGVLENQVSGLINRITNLENWKTLMEEWKISIETWKQSIIIQLAELNSRITDEVAKLNDAINVILTDLNLKIDGLTTRVANLENPNTVLEKIKQVDGSGSGLDADLLDGLDSSDFARTNGAHPDLSVGYATSAGNADTVDGKHASELLSLWTDGGGYIYPNNVGDSFQITNVGDLYVPSNIGISTAGPTQKLHIFSEATDAAIRLETGQRPGSHNFTMGVDNGDNKFKINVGHYLGYTNQFVIEEGGNVGIGTSDPQYTLHIESYRPGNWAASIVNTAGSSNGYGLLLESLSSDASSYNLFQVTNKEGTKFIVKGDGNVGIGTADPTEKLTVAGVVESTSGGFKFPDGTVQTTAAPGEFKTYDSGWFPCSTGSTYNKIHNLNTTAIIAILYFATDSNGSNAQNVSDGFRDYEGEERGGIIKDIGSTTFIIQAGAIYVHTGLDNDGNRIDYEAGYYRAVALALLPVIDYGEAETEESLPPASEEPNSPLEVVTDTQTLMSL